MNSERFENAKRHIPGGVNSPVRAFTAVDADPLFIDHAQGRYLFTADGMRYLDFCMSWGAIILGHDDAAVRSAIIDAAGRGCSFGFCHEREAILAAMIKEALPGIELIRFVNSGTEAVLSAVRLARGFTGRDIIVKFDGCYHGHGDGFLVAAGSGAGELVNASSAGVTAAVIRDTVSIPYNDAEAVERLFASRGDGIAAIIVEPVAGNMGLVPPAPGFLRLLRDVTARYGSLLIFDEVITGFRVCRGGVQTLEGITPDLTTLGKIIGGGMPVGAFGGRAEIMKLLAPLGPVYQAGTLSGNPVAMSAGIAVLERLRDDPGIYVRMAELTGMLARGLAGAPGITVNRYHTLFSVFFSDGPVHDFNAVRAQDAERFRRTWRAVFDAGILLPPSAFETGFVSAVHAPDDITLLAEAIRSA